MDRGRGVLAPVLAVKPLMVAEKNEGHASLKVWPVTGYPCPQRKVPKPHVDPNWLQELLLIITNKKEDMKSGGRWVGESQWLRR